MPRKRTLRELDYPGLEHAPSQWGKHDWFDVFYRDDRPKFSKRLIKNLEVGFDYKEDHEDHDKSYDEDWCELFKRAGYHADIYNEVTSLVLGSSPYIRCMLSVKRMPHIRRWVDGCRNLERLCLLGAPTFDAVHEGLISDSLKELWMASLDSFSTIEFLDSTIAPNLESLTWVPSNEYSRGLRRVKSMQGVFDNYENRILNVLKTFPKLKHLGMINFSPEPLNIHNPKYAYQFSAQSFWRLMEIIDIEMLESINLEQGNWKKESLDHFFNTISKERLPNLKIVDITATGVPLDYKPPKEWRGTKILRRKVDILERDKPEDFRYVSINE